MTSQAAQQKDDIPKHPGEWVRQLLEQRGWTQQELATITGFTRTHLSGVIAGRTGVTAEMAVALAAAFGNEPIDWLRCHAEYQLSLVPPDPAGVRARARLFELAPIRDMQRRGWVPDISSAEELESALNAFYDGHLDEGTFPVATLRREPASALSPSEKAWCFRARQLAQALAYVAPYDATRMPSCERKLRQLAAYPKEAERLPEMLAYYGIRFVIIEPLPGAKIDGAAFWLGESPVIAVSARWDRIDAFWFTVIHELMHIKHRDAFSLDVNLVVEGEHGIRVPVATEDAEQRASEAAAELLVPQAELESFIKRTAPLYAAARIVQFAHRIKMHPGIIVGQLQHRGELRYSSHRDLLVKVRQYIVETAVTDGWGRSVRIV